MHSFEAIMGSLLEPVVFTLTWRGDYPFVISSIGSGAFHLFV